MAGNPCHPRTQRNYMVLLPAELHYPSMERACLLLEMEAAVSKFSYKVTLESKGGTIQLFPPPQQPMIMFGFTCTPFQVPAPSQGSSEVATLRFQAQGGVDFTETKNVVIQRIDNAVVVQTDKATYRPGETVRFRIVTLNDNFKCAKIQYYIVELKDPNNNRIAQWLNVDAKACIADLSFTLSSDPSMGVYTINVENGLRLQTFLVEEQVLPRFELIIEEPTTIYSTQETFPVRVCARYTYGKGVRGHMNIKICRLNVWWYPVGRPCRSVEGETGASGCLTTTVHKSSLDLRNDDNYNGMTAEVSATFTERGTGTFLSASKYVPLLNVPVTIIYEEIDTYYRVQFPFNIKMLVKDQNGVPLSLQNVTLQISHPNDESIVRATDKDGRVVFTLPTKEWKDKVYIKPILVGNINLEQNYDLNREVLPLYSETNSSLRLQPVSKVITCGSTVSVRAEYSLDSRDLAYPRSVNLYYIVIGKPGVVVDGVKTITVPPLAGSLDISITFGQTLGPGPKMLAFLLLKNGTVAADRLLFNVETCFPNTASVQFSRSVASPKSPINVYLSSSAGSMCALRAVDKSVQISNEDKELTPEMVFNMFPYSVRGGYPDEVSENSPCWFLFARQVISKGFLPWPKPYTDILSLFMEIGVKILTNTRIQRPQVTQECPMVYPDMMAKEPLAAQPEAAGGDVVRKFFPDTWLWRLEKIDTSGRYSISTIAPDTITQFNARTFCMGDRGFGLSSEVSLTVFKSFFVDIPLPYSVIQGETLLLKALVFNYLKQCLKVQVTLMNSTDFSEQECKECLRTACLCADETQIFSWYIRANKTGSVPLTVRAEAISSTELCQGKKVYVPSGDNLDIIQKQLLVKPRGIKKEISQNQFLCLKDSGETVKKMFPLTLPGSFVKGSESAYIGVMGDNLGSALQNLDRLIQMPYGCGEQNMLTMAPIVYVLDYLKATSQLSTAQSSLALNYLQSGYQRQLNYKRSDGSYSAFGQSDDDGSTWLTIFVEKIFSQSMNYIFIDDQILKQSGAWLRSQQQPNGCITSRGKLYHTTMKGGVEDDLSLTAYFTAALLESGVAGYDDMRNAGLSCLRANISSSNNTYTLALMAYTFALANDLSTKQQLLNRLYPRATVTSTEMYWQYSLQSSTSSNLISANVELTTYILLSHLTGAPMNNDELQKSLRMVSWLAKQQNSNGGFQSTQDTVVAIQALAKYTRVTFNPKGSLSVTVTSQNVTMKFTVDQTNRLLLQTKPLPSIPGNYNVTITGSGCVFIQAVLKYNVIPEVATSAFSIEAGVVGCGEDIPLAVAVTVSYIGKRPVTNMVLIEVEMLSGFRANADGITSLMKSDLVKRVTAKRESVAIYLDQLDHETYTYYVIIEQEVEVRDLKPANVKMYDYYQMEDNAVTTYGPCPATLPPKN